MASEFEKLGLLPQFVQAVEMMGYDVPTPIQLAAIPALLEGRNVLGQAQTGTGKTAAFALPMLQKIQPGLGPIQALVMAPTRELAVQVAAATSHLAGTTGIRVLAVYGGQSYTIQTRQLDRGVDVVVGTPGRLLDLINQKKLDISAVTYLVLDEADEMLEMGFIDDVEAIMSKVASPDRQIALFSATLPAPIRKLADRYITNPHQIAIHPERLTVAETEQRYVRVHENNKMGALTRLLESEDVQTGLVFTRTRVRAQELADELNRRGIPAESLHGDLNQSRREWVLNRFRRHTITLLVATDVAARGLDIENVSHVFNFDMPEDAEDYVHRIGRTGRAGKKGIAITFLVPRERFKLSQVEAYTHQRVVEIQVPTKEEVIARRDERFIARLMENFGESKDIPERGLITRLVEENNFSLVQIAAAAIRLARAGDVDRPVDEFAAPAIVKHTPRQEWTSNETQAPRRENSSDRPQRAPSSSSWKERTLATLRADAPDRANKAPGDKARRGDAEAMPHHAKHQHETGYVRLRMNLGELHGVRPGDVVGAIASEVGIPGKAIGEIDIRRDYSFVDVSEKHVLQVLRESTGKYMLRGQPVKLIVAN